MTFEEAKKILKKEGSFLIKVSKGFEFSESPVWEKQEVVEAKRVVNENDFATAMGENEWFDRQERLKKEYEQNTKAPGSDEEQSKEKIRTICCSALPKADFYYKHVLNEGNPALKESATQFNDALLDEQAKKIKRLGKEIARLNKIIHKKNLKGKESSRHLEGKIKMFGENVDLEQMLKDKDAVLSDVAEELRLSKIREKNLTEVCQKYMKENEELWATLADNVVDKIDAQALKSAESALAYKEKEIEKLQKQLKYKSPLPSGSVEAINIYVENISRARRGGFNKSVASTMGETELSETYEYGDKKLKYALHFNEDGSITYECSDPDKKSRIPTPEESKYDSLIERCKRLGIELHYHDGEVLIYTNVFGDEVPVYGLRGIFATCTDEEYKSLFKK